MTEASGCRVPREGKIAVSSSTMSKNNAHAASAITTRSRLQRVRANWGFWTASLDVANEYDQLHRIDRATNRPSQVWCAQMRRLADLNEFS